LFAALFALLLLITAFGVVVDWASENVP